MFGLKLELKGVWQSFLRIISPPVCVYQAPICRELPVLDQLIWALGVITHYAIILQISQILYGWYQDVSKRRSLNRLQRSHVPGQSRRTNPRNMRVVTANDVADAIRFHQRSAGLSISHGRFHIAGPVALIPPPYPPSFLTMDGPKLHLNGRVEVWADGTWGLGAGLVRL
ncbi:hypothetical protein AA313_de0205166 [Arthrobotrys entomopaga]|nr:hypothetical protein AA313_de0205166 [Arthrobotrys entomopaga]